MSSGHGHHAKALRRIDRWRRDPCALARDVFGFEPWEDDEPGFDSQTTILRAIPHHRSIAVRSGHKTGKTRLLALIALWFYVFFPGVRVVLTAPTGRQINEAVWKEIRDLWAAAKRRGFDLGGRCFKTYEKGIRHPNGSEVFGLSTDEKDRFSGISGWLVVYLVDEGAGYDEEIWQAIRGNIAGGAWVITMGNPTRTEGTFYRAFHEDAHLWRGFRLSSERTPTARGLAVIRGLATRWYIEQCRRLWQPHETHPLYAVRVRGDFPAAGLMNVVSLMHLQAAEHRHTLASAELFAEQRLEVGVDCARFGDDSTCAVARRGLYVLPDSLEFGGADGPQSAGRIRQWVLAQRTTHEVAGVAPPPRIKVDVIGIGASIYDQLRLLEEEHHDIEAVAVNVATNASDEEKYANLRAEVWFGIDEWLAAGGMVPASIGDGRLHADLMAPRYRFDVRGRQIVEDKPSIKERLGRSPDHGDALSLCVYPAERWNPNPFTVQGLR